MAAVLEKKVLFRCSAYVWAMHVNFLLRLKSKAEGEESFVVLVYALETRVRVNRVFVKNRILVDLIRVTGQ